MRYVYAYFIFCCSIHQAVAVLSGVHPFQVIVSGKLRAQRAKSMKFKDGYMVSSGQPVKEYIDSAVRHVLLRQVNMHVVCFLLFSQELAFVTY